MEVKIIVCGRGVLFYGVHTKSYWNHGACLNSLNVKKITAYCEKHNLKPINIVSDKILL